MSDRHLTEADLAEIGTFADDDERRRHLETCPECRMLRARYAQFLAEPADVPAPDLADAERRLAQMLEREIQGSGVVGARDGFRPRVVRRTTWAMPALAAAAAVMIVAGTFTFLRRGGEDRPSGVLRGGAGATAVQLMAPGTDADAVELRWHGVTGAERYTVHIYAGDLNELTAIESADTLVRVPRMSFTTAAPGDTVLWRVVALRGGAPVAQSALGTVRVP